MNAKRWLLCAVLVLVAAAAATTFRAFNDSGESTPTSCHENSTCDTGACYAADKYRYCLHSVERIDPRPAWCFKFFDSLDCSNSYVACLHKQSKLSEHYKVGQCVKAPWIGNGKPYKISIGKTKPEPVLEVEPPPISPVPAPTPAPLEPSDGWQNHNLEQTLG